MYHTFILYEKQKKFDKYSQKKGGELGILANVGLVGVAVVGYGVGLVLTVGTGLIVGGGQFTSESIAF